MRSEQIATRSLRALLTVGLILAPAVAMSGPARRGPAPRRVHGPHPRPAVVPGPKVAPKAVVTPKGVVTPRTGVRVTPHGAVVIPRYRPRPVVRAGAAVLIYEGIRIANPIVPSTIVSPTELPAVPAKEFSQAEAYQVVSVGDDYTVTLSIDGTPTPVRLLGVEPLLVAAAEGEPGTLPDEALRCVHNLLVGEMVYLDQDPQLASTDADGVRVAYLHRVPDGLLMNLEIIRQGYGLVAEGYAFEYQDAFAANQSRAQATGKGIWGGLTPSQPAD